MSEKKKSEKILDSPSQIDKRRLEGDIFIYAFYMEKLGQEISSLSLFWGPLLNQLRRKESGSQAFQGEREREIDTQAKVLSLGLASFFL